MDASKGWDTTSDEDDGMEIDLDAKQGENNDFKRTSTSEDKQINNEEDGQADGLDYDPAEPTDDYDPTEPTPDDDSNKLPNEDSTCESKTMLSLVADYDPAEPTLSEEERDKENEDSTTDKEETGGFGASNEDNSLDGRWDSQLETLSPEDMPSDLPKETESGPDCVNDAETPTKGDSETGEGDDSVQTENIKDREEEEKLKAEGTDDIGVENTAFRDENSECPNGSRSPSLAPTDTDDNTRLSFADGANSDVPEVTIDESDFVLEKELFEPSSDQNNSQESPLTKDINISSPGRGDNAFVDSNASQEASSFQHQDPREEEQLEKNRTQEEVDSRNEEALVDLFREESDPDKIENDLEQPLKKTKKKVGVKKIKKKGKKLKKGQSKKGQSKLDGDDVEDQRFVELRGDRYSIESREEGEVDGGGNVDPASNWGELEDQLDLGKGSAEQVYDFNTGSSSHLDAGEDGEQREPGEIIEEGSKRKSGKKKDREKRRKKKSRREVATIEEGVQGDDDSQKFPSFLAGFFVQDEDGGEEDIADKIENISHSYEVEEDRTFQKGGKTYRKRHASGAEDSVKSGEEALEGLLGQEVRTEEADHRKSRSHEERRHSSREHRHHDRDTREVRREKEGRHGTPREKEREKVRERDRGRHERERVRERENREREVVRERDRERERSRRGERDERRRRHASRSGSRERRKRSGSAERNRRSRSRERALRHRRHRSRSQERDRERERARRSNRERSREREFERRGSGRRASHSRSRSPRHRSERGSSNKENREESRSSRRRVVSRSHQEGTDSEGRESHRLSHRRQRRERERDRDRERQRERSSSSSSSSSNSSSSSSSDRVDANSHRQHRSHRDQYNHDYASEREHHHRDYHHHHHRHERSSSEEGASSDVILVEPEKIVINLDEEEDPPSRVDITHANAEDDSTTMIDGESIPPPPDLRQNTRASALIEIAASSVVDQPEDDDQEEGDATPTRDERTDEVVDKQPQSHQAPSAQETAPEVGDYDPAHPTEEPEDRESRPHVAAAPSNQSTLAPPLPSAPLEQQLDSGPVPPSHPPPQEIRPSPPPVPAMPEPSVPPRLTEGPHGLRPQLTPNQFPNPPLSQPHRPPMMPGQQPRFPPVWSLGNKPTRPGMPGFPTNQRGLLPTPDTQPLFPMGDNSRQQTPFSSLQGRREQQMSQNQPPVPISAMAPLAQLTSLLPALERAKMSSHQNNDGGISSQGFKEQPFPISSAGTMMKAPLMSNAGPNLRNRMGRTGTDQSDSTEVVDMDMSPGEDDCELELPSPRSSESDKDERRRRGRKSDSHTSRAASDMSKGTGAAGGKSGGPIQPAVYLKALRKVIERMTPKGQPSAPGGGGSAQDKGKSQERRKRRPMEVSAEDDVPASAVELTNKEKYLKKLHLQERVIDEVKLAIKPFYSSKKINKEQYKLILRKAVPKVCHSKSERINPQKIQQLVEAYVGKLAKGSSLDGGHAGHSSKRKKGPHNAGGNAPPNKDGSGVAGAAPHVRQNGDRGKKASR